MSTLGKLRRLRFPLLALILSLYLSTITCNDLFQEFAKSLVNLNPNNELKKLLEVPAKLFESQNQNKTPHDKLLEPIKMFTNPTTGLQSLGSVIAATKTGSSVAANTLNGAAEAVIKKVSSDPINVVKALGISSFAPVKAESELAYYDKPTFALEGDDFRKPHYFSRDCEFRVACEFGRKFKLLALKPVTEIIKTNKVIHNLQNRYTRAISYGMMEDNCDKYYCLFLKLVGQPSEFASGLAELLNRLANPEMYD